MLRIRDRAAAEKRFEAAAQLNPADPVGAANLALTRSHLTGGMGRAQDLAGLASIDPRGLAKTARRGMTLAVAGWLRRTHFVATGAAAVLVAQWQLRIPALPLVPLVWVIAVPLLLFWAGDVRQLSAHIAVATRVATQSPLMLVRMVVLAALSVWVLLFPVLEWGAPAIIEATAPIARLLTFVSFGLAWAWARSYRRE